jgi:hypothetical protein
MHLRAKIKKKGWRYCDDQHKKVLAKKKRN